VASLAHRRQWAWYVSALGYRWSDTSVARSADADVFRFLDERLLGARVLDCGCGPGISSERLVARGASYVLAVDANPSMVRQARAHLRHRIAAGSADVERGFVDAAFFGALGRTFDLVFFKRSLYARRAATVSAVRAALAAVEPHGMVVVVHPVRSLLQYAFGTPARLRPHTAFHILNRAISLVAARLGISEYRAYSKGELWRLLSEAADDGSVQEVPTTQQAYAIMAITACDQVCSGRRAS